MQWTPQCLHINYKGWRKCPVYPTEPRRCKCIGRATAPSMRLAVCLLRCVLRTALRKIMMPVVSTSVGNPNRSSMALKITFAAICLRFEYRCHAAVCNKAGLYRQDYLTIIVGERSCNTYISPLLPLPCTRVESISHHLSVESTFC